MYANNVLQLFSNKCSRVLHHFVVVKANLNFVSTLFNSNHHLKVKMEENSTKRTIEELSDENDVSIRKTPIEETIPIVKAPRKKFKANFVETPLDISDYYIENGLRKVYPYNYTYYSYCKGRWIGKKLVDIFQEEFRAVSEDIMILRIQKGYLKVNGNIVDENYILKDNDFITNYIHRHEFPVLAVPIPIIHIDDDLLVIDKPPSLPVHPCGKYRLNTITSLLEKENNIKDIHVVHRLDRLTSGIMIMARTKARAQKLHEEMRNREMHKEYLCRVEGKFPDGIVECEQPIETLSHRIGICIVSSTGKSSKTTFERLNYNGKSSTVLCKPLTGRMHQIRVHLQYLGFPIVNDSFYNSSVFGTHKGKNAEYGKSLDQLIKDIDQDHIRSKYLIENNVNQENHCDEINQVAIKALAHYTSQETWQTLKQKYEYDSSKFSLEENCEDCKFKTVDPTPREQLIYLHALRYKGKDWSFESQTPIWAKENWTLD